LIVKNFKSSNLASHEEARSEESGLANVIILVIMIKVEVISVN